VYWSGGFEQIVQAGKAGKTLASRRAFASFAGFGGVATRHVPIPQQLTQKEIPTFGL